MTYAIRYANTSPSIYREGVLVELTRAETKALGPDAADDRWYYRYCSAQAAHRWVRNDGVHETGLWLDAGRIRKAESAPDF